MDHLREGLSSNRMDSDALRRVCARAYLSDPTRTHNDLIAMGLSAFAHELRHDHSVGRLQEHAATLEPSLGD